VSESVLPKRESIQRRDRVSFLQVGVMGLLWWIAYRSLPVVANWFSFEVLRLDPASRLGQSVAFFVDCADVLQP